MVELIKKLYKEGLNGRGIKYTIKEDTLYLRYKNRCYKTDKSNIDDINKIITTIKDCTDTYNEINISDLFYVDGFVFPSELTGENESDEFICNLCTIDRENGFITINDRLGKKIPYKKFLSALNSLEEQYKKYLKRNS